MPGHAGPKWSLLSPEERRPYEQMVKSDAADLEGIRPKGKMNNQVFDPNSVRTYADGRSSSDTVLTTQGSIYQFGIIVIWHIDYIKDLTSTDKTYHLPMINRS